MATELTAVMKIRPQTKARIEAAKVYPRETIDDALTRLLDEREAARRPQDAQEARESA